MYCISIIKQEVVASEVTHFRPYRIPQCSHCSQLILLYAVVLHELLLYALIVIVEDSKSVFALQNSDGDAKEFLRHL
jgi:hypothetical protein